ncbi:hypothetical protein [Leucobacter sp. W1153]|uniref:hypothetical protein n=1 Tax=unclassified Leucobacter TaxID=2621730 RepID=UPI003F2E6E31
MAGRLTTWILGALVTVLYLYLVVAGVGNLLGLTEMSALLGLSLTGTGWFWVVFGIALPVVGYAAALLIARGKSAALRVLVLATGLAVVAAVQLEVLHLVPQSSFFA